MSQAPQMQREKRGARVKLGGSVLALLQLEKPLDEGIVVEVLFHVGSTTVRSQAQMLFPMWATKGCLQPFRFKDLEDATRVSLEEELNGLLKASPGAVADDTNLP